MNRPALAVAFALATVHLSAQEAVTNPKIAEVTWREAYDSQGNRSSIPVFARAASDRTPMSGRQTFNEQSGVLRVDEQFRLAKLTNDVQTMAQILGDEFFETNQNGNSRDKAQALDLWTTFKITSLNTERATIRMAGNVATMSGEETEVNATGTDRMLFTRVYVRSASNDWKLLSSAQFRNPKN